MTEIVIEKLLNYGVLGLVVVAMGWALLNVMKKIDERISDDRKNHLDNQKNTLEIMLSIKTIIEDNHQQNQVMFVTFEKVNETMSNTLEYEREQSTKCYNTIHSVQLKMFDILI